MLEVDVERSLSASNTEHSDATGGKLIGNSQYFGIAIAYSRPMCRSDKKMTLSATTTPIAPCGDNPLPRTRLRTLVFAVHYRTTPPSDSAERPKFA